MAAEDQASFLPQDSTAPLSGTTEVQIHVDATHFKSGQVKFTYDATCADVTGWERNTSDFPMGTWESGTSGEEWITFSAQDAITGAYSIGTLTIRCISEEACTTALDFVEDGPMTSKLFDDWGSEISTAWQDGRFRGGYGVYLPIVTKMQDFTTAFEEGAYRCTITTDGGVHLWLDDRLLVDQWQDRVATYDADVSLTQGYHWVRLEYYDGGGP